MSNRPKNTTEDSKHSNGPAYFSDFLKGAGPGRRFGTDDRYSIRTEPGSHSTAMITARSTDRTKGGAPTWDPVLRFDRPHKGANYHHININSKFSGRPDPHLRVPSAVVEAAPKVGKVLKGLNEVATPVAVLVDAYRIGSAVVEDRKHRDKKYPRTMIETSGVAGGWAGALAGGAAGARMGTALCPGVGTIIGGTVLAIAGGFAGDAGCRGAAEMAVKRYSDDESESDADSD